VTSISFHRGPVGEPGSGLIYRGLRETDEGYVEKALETSISFHKGSNGEPGRDSFTSDFERWMKGAVQVERLSLSLSLRELCEVNLEGRLLCWGPWRKCIGRLWRRASLCIGAPLGNLEVGSYTEDFER